MFLKPFDQLEMILVADAESVSEDIIRTVRKKLEKIMKLFQCRGMTFTKGRDAIGITGAKLPDPWDGDVYLSIRDPKTNTFAVAAKILAAVTKVLQQSPIEKPSFFHTRSQRNS